MGHGAFVDVVFGIDVTTNDGFPWDEMDIEHWIGDAKMKEKGLDICSVGDMVVGDDNPAIICIAGRSYEDGPTYQKTISQFEIVSLRDTLDRMNTLTGVQIKTLKDFVKEHFGIEDKEPEWLIGVSYG